MDQANGNTINYKKENSFLMPLQNKLIYKTENEKYINISNIKVDIIDKDKDYSYLNTSHSFDDLNLKLEKLEIENSIDLVKQDAKNVKKKKDVEKLENPEETSIKFENTVFTEQIFKTLKTTGYIDTVNRFFLDVNNTIYLEGKVNKVTNFRIAAANGWSRYFKSKFYMTWYIKNNYDEYLDSVFVQSFSDDFLFYKQGLSVTEEIELKRLAYADAVDNCYLELLKKPIFLNYTKIEKEFKNPETVLTLSQPKSSINNKKEAPKASVIVKTKNGHGSGFSITHDGYILTNYHVISDRYPGDYSEITVITNDGEKHIAKVIRVNKYQDLALLKIERNFEKVFEVSEIKSFENHQDVFTIGAPKSIELGQSISYGIISNERKSNNNYLLQLSMSVNPGNSGGPLLDENGKLHGIIVSKAVGVNTEGIGFAIPSYKIQEYLNISFN
ncbi:MAG: trypsin-like peptidase domain-containing protein [Bacteroidetes bacterium]|nr:trypsin-like peptidase domain-containing protein [Bacteroidota bacterium]